MVLSGSKIHGGILVALTGFGVAAVSASNVTASEYIAFVPSSGKVTWQEVHYPANLSATTADEVTFTDISGSPEALGSWADELDLDGTPTLTARVYGEFLYAQLNTGRAPGGDSYPGGCCADTLRQVSKEDGSTKDIEIDSIIAEIFDGIADTDSGSKPWAYANHAFDLTIIGEDLIALIDVAYKETQLEGAMVDAVVAINLTSGAAIPTVTSGEDGGDLFFSWWRRVGTDSTSFEDGIYKIQYWATSSGSEGDQQYHQNGVTRFWSNSISSSPSSVAVLGATHKTHGEAVLVKCPFTYSPAEGGGSILQRFGSPYHHDGTTIPNLRGNATRKFSSETTTHSFGIDASSGNGIVALHNLYHTAYPDGTETVALFVNEAENSDVSMAWEFVVKLVEEPSGSYDDTVFATDYWTAPLSFSENTWGGVRPVGKGVWIVGRNGMEAIQADSMYTAFASKEGARKQTLPSSRLTDPPPPPPSDDDNSGPPGPPSDDDNSGPPGTDDDHSNSNPTVYDSFCFQAV